MTAVELDFTQTDVHPIDIVESLAEQCEWDFDRVGENQIAMAIEGAWRTYSLTLAWSGHDDLLRLVCTHEFSLSDERRDEFLDLLNRVNDRIWQGAFCYWPEQKLLVFRHGMSLAGGAMATPEQIESIVLSAVMLSERFYPAFQLVAYASEAPEAALSMAIDEAYGTA